MSSSLSRSQQLERAGVQLQVERERRVVVVAVVELAVPARVVEDAVHEQRVRDGAVGVQRPEVARAEAALQLAERVGGVGERGHRGSHRTIVPGMGRARGCAGGADRARPAVCGRLPGMPTRPEWYRRRGPDGPSPLQPVLDSAARVVNRRAALRPRAPPWSRRPRCRSPVGADRRAQADRHAPGADAGARLRPAARPGDRGAQGPQALRRGGGRLHAPLQARLGAALRRARRSCAGACGSTSRSASTPSSASAFRPACGCSARCAGPAR